MGVVERGGGAQFQPAGVTVHLLRLLPDGAPEEDAALKHQIH